MKIGRERTLAGEAAGGSLRSRGRRMCERDGREFSVRDRGGHNGGSGGGSEVCTAKCPPLVSGG
ncbi:MAG: hypothetical protein ACTS4X_01455 [Candidatus Hodgkinia cicadicola]